MLHIRMTTFDGKSTVHKLHADAITIDELQALFEAYGVIIEIEKYEL